MPNKFLRANSILAENAGNNGYQHLHRDEY